MLDYKKTIEDNSGEFNDGEQLEDFLNCYIQEDTEDLDDLDDNLSEYADGLVPVYYNEIIKEWQENGDCQGLTMEVLGETSGEVYKIMMSDLFFYYEQQLREDLEKLKELIEDPDEITSQQ